MAGKNKPAAKPGCACNHGWVCEDPNKPWEHDGCGAAGVECDNPDCTKDPDSIFVAVHRCSHD